MRRAGRPEYANVWEDSALDLDVLEPREGDRALCVTSGGCTALALAGSGASVLAVDAAFPQTALLALKLAALRGLPLELVSDFLGVRRLGQVTATVDRADLYRSVAESLAPDVRVYWDRHRTWIERGVLDQGWTEVYMNLARRLYHLFVHGREACERWFLSLDDAERQRWFADHWDTRRRRLFLRLLFSPRLLGRVYKTAAVYTDVDAAPTVLRQRLDRALLERPIADNYFLARLFTGRFLQGERGVPPYLGESLGRRFAAIDPGRVQVQTVGLFEALEHLPPASLDLFALSNVVDWMVPSEQERLFRLVTRAAAPGARLMLRSVFSAWRPPAFVAARLELPGSPDALLARERAFVYGSVLGGRLDS